MVRSVSALSVKVLGKEIHRAHLDDSVGLRLCIEFWDRCEEATTEEVVALVREQPAPTGSERWDAMLAALTEHACVRAGLVAPAWAQAPERFLQQSWFVERGSTMRAAAIAESPAAFRRRAIWIAEGELLSV